MPVVIDETAILAYLEDDNLRWNANADLGTQVVVTYRFVETSDLENAVTYDSYGASKYLSYTDTQRGYFRDVIEIFEDTAGIRFVEIEGEAMINVFASTGSSFGGWANLPWVSDTYTGTSDLTNNSSTMTPGSYGYLTNMHELGHAVGLSHPHEGNITLADLVDNTSNTVMTYNNGDLTASLGKLDILALQDLYGETDAFDGWYVSSDSNDNVVIRATEASETILAPGQNTNVKGGGGADIIVGGGGNDSLHGQVGADEITGKNGNDKLFGGRGNDRLTGGATKNDYSGSFDETDNLFGGNGRDKLFGGGGNDKLFGGQGNDRMFGGNENDFLRGGSGNDLMFGGNGNDMLKGGSGEDRIDGGGGDDTLKGGSGADLFVFEDYYDEDVITDFTQGEDQLDLTELGMASLSILTQTVNGGDLEINYYSYFTLLLEGVTSALTVDDILI